MKKFSVDVSRRFWQIEAGSVLVEAKTERLARAKAKAIMAEDDSRITDWEPQESGYDDHTIEHVESVDD